MEPLASYYGNKAAVMAYGVLLDRWFDELEKPRCPQRRRVLATQLWRSVECPGGRKVQFEVQFSLLLDTLQVFASQAGQVRLYYTSQLVCR